MIPLDTIVNEVAGYYRVDPEAIRKPRKSQRTVFRARCLVCHVAVKELGYRTIDVARYFGRGRHVIENAIDVIRRAGDEYRNDVWYLGYVFRRMVGVAA